MTFPELTTSNSSSQDSHRFYPLKSLPRLTSTQKQILSHIFSFYKHRLILSISKPLTTLKINKLPLLPCHLYKLSCYCKESQQDYPYEISQLHFHYCSISIHHVISMNTLLQSIPMLQLLDLRGNNLHNMLHQLTFPSTLKQLYCYKTNLTYEDIVKFSVPSEVTEICLGGNLLTDESAFELRNKLICDYNQVKKLYLDGNDIGLQGAKLLLECERLEVIYLNHNLFKENEKQELMKMCNESNRLLYLGSGYGKKNMKKGRKKEKNRYLSQWECKDKHSKEYMEHLVQQASTVDYRNGYMC